MSVTVWSSLLAAALLMVASAFVALHHFMTVSGTLVVTSQDEALQVVISQVLRLVSRDA